MVVRAPFSSSLLPTQALRVPLVAQAAGVPVARLHIAFASAHLIAEDFRKAGKLGLFLVALLTTSRPAVAEKVPYLQ